MNLVKENIRREKPTVLTINKNCVMAVPDAETEKRYYLVMCSLLSDYVCSLLCILQIFVRLRVVRLSGSRCHTSSVSSYASVRI